ncbi:MAG: HlyC/CorC family transporter [Chlamydiales bacterium]|jgi:CBS domain containing-hemolysin-like protein|nr:HlyC/CorC family transporter [Chlamydiales bacterium]
MFLIFSFALLLMNALFVGAEFAFVGSRRSKIEELIQEGRSQAIELKKLLLHLDRCLSTCQVGITLCSLGLGWLGERTFASTLDSFFTKIELVELLGPLHTEITIHSISIATAFCLVTTLHVVLGELAPKSIALIHPEQLAIWLTWPIKVFNYLFAPIVLILNKLAWFVLYLLRIKRPTEHARAFSEEEIHILLEESQQAGVVTTEEQTMLQRVFQFHDKIVKEVMTPRPDIKAIPIETPLNLIIKTMLDSGFSRMPVYQNTIDHIIGIIYLKDAIRALREKPNQDIKTLIRALLEIPETYAASKLLKDFQDKRVHMAIVLDEFGSISGVITLEDIIEELVGEIRDEYDHEPEEVQQIDENTYLFEGRTSIGLFKTFFPHLVFENDDFESVAGLILSLAGHLPKEKDQFTLQDLRFEVIKIDGRRLKKILVIRNTAEG